MVEELQGDPGVLGGDEVHHAASVSAIRDEISPRLPMGWGPDKGSQPWHSPPVKGVKRALIPPAGRCGPGDNQRSLKVIRQRVQSGDGNIDLPVFDLLVVIGGHPQKFSQRPLGQTALPAEGPEPGGKAGKSISLLLPLVTAAQEVVGGDLKVVRQGHQRGDGAD